MYESDSKQLELNVEKNQDKSNTQFKGFAGFPFGLKEILHESKVLFKSALPTALTYVCNIAMGLTCFRFIGKYGTPEELGGASLGYTWANVFCLGIFFSIDHGFSVIAARLFGAKKYTELGILFQRNFCVLMCLALPLIFSLIFADKVLIAFGLNYEVSVSAGIFLKSIIPSLMGMCLFNTMRFFLISQNVFHIQGLILSLLVPLHIFWCYLFVDVLEMPVAGAGIAKSITDVSGAVALFLYIQYSNVCKESWIPFRRECLQRLPSHLKETFMLGGNLYVEWVSYEISMFIIGVMNNPFIMGAHGVAINFTLAVYTIPLGNSVSMQTFVGNAVGEGRKTKAQKFMIAGMMINLFASGFNVLAMIFLNKQIAEFFTNEEETQVILQNILFMYGLAHFQDTYSNHLGGILRVLGREEEVVANYVYCYIIVTLSLQWILGITFDFGYTGVWIGTDVGMCLMFILMIRKLMKLNWTEEIAKVRKNMDSMHYEDENTVYVEMIEKH